MTISYFAPLPPARSGVADYAASLLGGLRALGPVQVASDAGVPLYQIGNNQLHAAIYRRALERPGAVLLHDAVLHHLMLGMLDRAAYVEEFVYNYGEWYRQLAEGLWERRGTSGGDEAYFRYPMLRRLAEVSPLLMVHNPAAAKMVRNHAPAARVEIVPHYFSPPDAVAAVELPKRGPTFAIFGHLRETKRVHVVAQALARVPNAQLLIAGEFVSSDYSRAIEPLLGQNRVQRLPLGSEAELWGRMHAADACINLRAPSAGETSGIAIRAMGIGKPVVVTRGDETADFPEHACVKVTPGPAERAELEAMMCWLASSPADRDAIGVRAEDHIRSHHTLDKVATQIWTLLQALCLLVAMLLPASGAAKQEFKVAMRDGVKLATNVYLPNIAGKFPVLLLRTPYNKGATLPSAYLYFVEEGYAFVIQDVRGRYGSEGQFQPMVQEAADGEDTLRWIAAQPWCDSNIGMLGGSYSGLVQWKAALSGVPALKALWLVHAGADEYFDRFYSKGGAFRLGHRLLWLAQNMRTQGSREPAFEKYVQHTPLRTVDRAFAGHRLDLLQLALDHPTYDSFWRDISARQHVASVNVPAFALAGWFDPNVESDLDMIAALRAQGKTARIAVGPWGHNMSIPLPNAEFGPEKFLPMRPLMTEWFGHWLKDLPGIPAGGPVSLFVMGANRWRDEAEWPLKRAVATKFYLAPQHRLTSSPGTDGVEAYTYDPSNPVPTMGGGTCCDFKIFPWGPQDQRSLEARKDVLVFSTDSLTEPVEATGSIKGELFVSTSATDTDFTVKLMDVFPDGEARLLTDGILRLRYRAGLDKVTLAKPGEIYSITIDAGVTSNVFLPGHRIRVHISSSNFPKYDRNPNTGRPIADERQIAIAHQKVFFGRRSPSHVQLPVVSRPF